MKRQTNGIGKPGKQLLMAALLITGLALSDTGQAEAHPGNPPPPQFGKPMPPLIVHLPLIRYDYGPAPPPRQ
ncbi:MAG: hypothetical protein LBH14_07790 [Desulfobulbaceae bacterium]|jgi:hypothetical protein|nr:hypothetical protein [Desulfobulbaceae bacterium]